MDHIVLDLPVACAAWLRGRHFNAAQTILKNNMVFDDCTESVGIIGGLFLHVVFQFAAPFPQFCVAVAAKKRYNIIYGNFETKHQYRSADM